MDTGQLGLGGLGTLMKKPQQPWNLYMFIIQSQTERQGYYVDKHVIEDKVYLTQLDPEDRLCESLSSDHKYFGGKNYSGHHLQTLSTHTDQKKALPFLEPHYQHRYNPHPRVFDIFSMGLRVCQCQQHIFTKHLLHLYIFLCSLQKGQTVVLKLWVMILLRGHISDVLKII